MEKCTYDRNQPQGTMSLNNMRNTLRALHQGDLMPLRPRASMILDDMEYATDNEAGAVWDAINASVSSSTTKQEGNFAILIEGDTSAGTITKTESLDLSAFLELKIWEQGSTASQSLTFFVKDSSLNESYWNITTNSTPDTWQQDTLDLSTPDSNNGSDADLSDITDYGFKTEASKDYIIDTIKAACGLNVAVEGSDLSDYYKQVYIGDTPIETVIQSSPAITPPLYNPRIDILIIDETGLLSWIEGDEDSSPAAKWEDMPIKTMAICLVYCRVGMTKILDFEMKDSDTGQGYIYADTRPVIRTGYSLPSGIIVMWSGTLATIPDGFILCDGNNDTPPLLDRFILSIPNASTNPGETGGSNSVTLAEENLPSHTHSCNTTGDHGHSGSTATAGDHGHSASTGGVGNHSHGYDRASMDGNQTAQNGCCVHANLGQSGANTSGAGSHSHSVTVNSNGSHTHSLSVSNAGNHSHTIGSTGSGTAVTLPNPLYYRLAFIMAV